MTSYYFTAQVSYGGVVEADTEDEARILFYQELNSYYEDTEDETVEELEECEECGNVLDPDGLTSYLDTCQCDEDEEDGEE